MSESSTEEQILLEAERKTSAAYADNPSVANLREWDAAKKALERFHQERQTAVAGARFKNLSEVSRWLIQQGYKTTDRTVRNHKKDGYFPEQVGGGFLQRDIETYAQRHLERPGHTDRKDEVCGKDRLTEAMAEEREIRVKKLRGELIDAAEEEARDARIWRAIRSDVELEAPSVINELVEQVLNLDGHSEEMKQRISSLTPILRELYEEKVADIFNRFAVEGGVWVEEE